MPSPFPGMDPYLENPSLWPGVHQALIVYLNAAINRILPAGLRARIDERLYVLEPLQRFRPDIALLQPRPAADSSGVAGAASATIAVLEPSSADEPIRLRLYREDIREPYIEICRVGEGSVVTVIEILSPANKASGRGREEYRRKQNDILDSETHLVEIDLLRGGEHTVAAPWDALYTSAGRWDYLVCIHRAPRPAAQDDFDAWPFTVRSALPVIAVPLLPDTPDLPLALPPIFDRTYDEGRFLDPADYADPPQPPLNADDDRWADTLLRENGYR